MDHFLSGNLSSNMINLLLIIVPVVLSLFAQFLVKSTFAKYSKVQNSRNINGAQTAKLLMQINDIRDVGIQSIAGSLTDHYDPSNKVLRLSEPVYDLRVLQRSGLPPTKQGTQFSTRSAMGHLFFEVLSFRLRISVQVLVRIWLLLA